MAGADERPGHGARRRLGRMPPGHARTEAHGEKAGPEEQRTFHPAPQRTQPVRPRHRPAGGSGDVLEAVVAAQHGPAQRCEGNAQEGGGACRAAGRDFGAASSMTERRAQCRHQDEPARRDGGEERDMTDRGDHRSAAPAPLALQQPADCVGTVRRCLGHRFGLLRWCRRLGRSGWWCRRLNAGLGLGSREPVEVGQPRQAGLEPGADLGGHGPSERRRSGSGGAGRSPAATAGRRGAAAIR